MWPSGRTLSSFQTVSINVIHPLIPFFFLNLFFAPFFFISESKIGLWPYNHVVVYNILRVDSFQVIITCPGILTSSTQKKGEEKKHKKKTFFSTPQRFCNLVLFSLKQHYLLGLWVNSRGDTWKKKERTEPLLTPSCEPLHHCCDIILLLTARQFFEPWTQQSYEPFLTSLTPFSFVIFLIFIFQSSCLKFCRELREYPVPLWIRGTPFPTPLLLPLTEKSTKWWK